MTKNNNELVTGITQGLQEAIEFMQGKDTGATVYFATDVKAIRQKQKLSQSQFAKRYGFTLSTVQHWEQGSRIPDKASKMILKLIDKYPHVAEEIAKIA